MATILLIDDEPSLLRMSTRALEAAGYMVVGCGNGRTGIQQIEEAPPDLVVTDIFMPEMEGLETIKAAHRLRPEMPIIAISGGGSLVGADYLDAARSFGAAAILRKPFKPAELVALIARLLPQGGD